MRKLYNTSQSSSCVADPYRLIIFRASAEYKRGGGGGDGSITRDYTGAICLLADDTGNPMHAQGLRHTGRNLV